MDPVRVSPSDHEHAHAEDGHVEPIVGFDYATIDRAVFHVEPEDDPEILSADEIDAACAVFRKLVEWMWQNGMNQPEGLLIRAIIICWVFTPQLRALTLTQMAQGFGKKKQSLGRWVDDFKKAFPKTRVAHMKD